MSIVGILLAVLFVFAGCEGPAGPTGLQGDDGSDVPFPGEITVTIPGGNNVPSLPAGVTYPPLTGAKILSGSAADISKAFNGGIFVTNTPDSGDLDTTGSHPGTVYGQDAVDYVVWTGIADSSIEQGSIVVPPGKTLFIAAPLVVNDTFGAGDGYFQGITVSDAGTFSPVGIASVQAATVGGTTIDSINEGKIVLLNGGRINGTVGPITIGGTLEIHHGASIVLTGATFLTTAKSTTNVYGGIIGGAEILTFDGDLAIKGGGLVSGSTGDDGYGNSDTYGPYGTVIVESYGALRLGNPGTNNARVNFYGPVTVQENASLSLHTVPFPGPYSDTEPVTFHKLADISGLLTIGNNIVTVPAGGHLKINATGGISANAWDRISIDGITLNGSDVSLLAAIAPNAAPSLANKRTTIAVPDTGLVTLEFLGEIAATTYKNLCDLAASTVLDLPGGITATLDIPPNDYLAFGPSDPILNVTTNNVILAAGYESIGNVFVAKGKRLTLGTPIKSAGEITVYGDLVANTSTFEDKLDKLTIGAAPAGTDPAIEVDIDLGAAAFNVLASPEIVVNQGSTLSLGSGIVNVNPAGSITLNANAELTIAGNTSALDRLKTLSIADGAVFDSTVSNVTSFKELEFLTVNGVLNADVDSVADPDDISRYLQEHVVDTRTGDVIGSGKAVFANWDVRADDAHAFDQLLGIKDLTVLSVTGIPKTSGNEAGWTADANKPPAGTEGIILRATNVNVPEDGFTVDRDLQLIGTLTFYGADNTVAINQGAKIVTGPLAGPGLMSGSTSAPVILVSGGATTLAATTGTLTVDVSTLAVQLGTILKVDGTLIAGDTENILAGAGTGEIVLVGGTSLKDGLIASKGAIGDANAAAAITVNPVGTLTIDGDSTVGVPSTVTIIPGGKLVANNGETLTFGGATALVIDNGSLTSSRTDTVITATDATHTTISGGDLILTTGGDMLAVGAGELVISSSVIIRGSGTSYDSLSIGGVRLTNAVFNATVGAPVLTLDTATNGTLTGTGGSLTTKNAGVLNIGTIATLKATNQLLANNVVLKATAGLTAGTLSLANSAVLTIGANFTVGDATATGNPGLVATLDVSTSGSKIIFGGAYNIGLVDVAGTQVSGALKISSSLSLVGLLAATADTAAAWGTAPAGATITAVAMGANDIYAANTGNATHLATNSGGSTAVVASGVVTITGTNNNTITTTTRLGLSES